VNTVRRFLRFSLVALVIYGGLVFLTWKGFQRVPSGFVPQQDKQYLVAFTQLPDAASLDRTDAVMREMSRLALETPGVKDAIAFPGLSIQGFTIAPNEGIVFVGLDSFEDRTTAELTGGAIAQTLGAKFAGIQEGFVAVFPLWLHPSAAGRGHADRKIRAALLRLHGQCAAARCRHRPREGEDAKRAAAKHLRHAPDQSRLALRE
jgi:multidrug efflux pump subunit AcrB